MSHCRSSIRAERNPRTRLDLPAAQVARISTACSLNSLAFESYILARSQKKMGVASEWLLHERDPTLQPTGTSSFHARSFHKYSMYSQVYSVMLVGRKSIGLENGPVAPSPTPASGACEVGDALSTRDSRRWILASSRRGSTGCPEARR
jgi:hypothetical protein